MFHYVSKIWFALAILAITAASSAAGITDIKIGRQQNYTLLVISCDKPVPYIIDQNGAEIAVAFSPNTSLLLSTEQLMALTDSLISSLDYSDEAGTLTITVKRDYELKVYSQKFPFKLVLDFTHRPGPPAAVKKEIVAENKPQQKEILPESQPPQAADTEMVIDEKSATSTETQTENLNGKDEKPSGKHEVFEQSFAYDTLGVLKHFVNYWDEGEELPMGPIPNNETFRRGMNLKRQARYEEALALFLKSAPSVKGQGHYQAALMYKRLGEPEKAIRELSLAINEKPNSIPPRIELAYIYQYLGKTKKAEEIWLELLTVLPQDEVYDFSKVASQVELLETMLSYSDIDILKPPPVDYRNLPRIPWIWIISGLALILTIVGGKILSNWRMNRLYKAVAGEEEKPEFPEPVEEPPEKDAAESLAQAVEKSGGEEEIDEEADIMSELAALGVSTEGLSDEKQQRIYELAKQNYSIAEIARMLNMGQEEVKFILDFRTKTEDNTIKTSRK